MHNRANMLRYFAKFVAMKVPNYFFIALIFLALGCSEFQKALKNDDLTKKNELAAALYEEKGNIEKQLNYLIN